MLINVGQEEDQASKWDRGAIEADDSGIGRWDHCEMFARNKSCTSHCIEESDWDGAILKDL